MTNTGKLRYQMFFTFYTYHMLLKRPRALLYWRGKRVKFAYEASGPSGRSLLLVLVV